MDNRQLLLEHFQNNYCVVIGHPTDNGKAATHLVYYTIMSKKDKKCRGEIDDIEWVTNVLKEIGKDYTTELCTLTIQISNEFTESLTKNRNI